MELRNPFRKRYRIACFRSDNGAEIPWKAPQREPRFRTRNKADAECWRWNQNGSGRFLFEVRAIR